MDEHLRPWYCTLLAVTFVVLPGCAGTSDTRTSDPPALSSARGAGQHAAGGEQLHEERLRAACIDAKWFASTLEDLIRADPRNVLGGIRSVSAEHPGSELVIIGTAGGIEAARRFIAHTCELSPPGGEGAEAIPLIHAAASDVVHKIGPTADPHVRVIVDEPTNSIIVWGVPAQRERLREAILTLDTPEQENDQP